MRGALSRGLRPHQWTWIIPADAGSTFGITLCCCSGEDHPRGCGEHLIDLLMVSTRPGSSPRMRGAPCSSPPYAHRLRIIPADAGSTITKIDWSKHDEDHPRGCGEHIMSPPEWSLHGGSSPRMRGALRQGVSGFPWMRIIPADAGSTREQPASGSAPQDHPRGCGEHWTLMVARWSSWGSSPRMRGAPRLGWPE